jgi:hypothetical protein
VTRLHEAVHSARAEDHTCKQTQNQQRHINSFISLSSSGSLLVPRFRIHPLGSPECPKDTNEGRHPIPPLNPSGFRSPLPLTIDIE